LKPLHGIIVADFSRVLAGPLCTQLLADAGARVIKIESPEGDETRRWGPPFAGEVSAYFLSINRNKESLGLDLRRGGDVARRLIERADVVVDNFLPAQRRAVGMDDVRGINPRAVHCSITGYDADEPMFGLPALTSVRVPFVQMGAYALSRLIERIEQPSLPRMQVLFDCEIVHGATTGPAPSNGHSV